MSEISSLNVKNHNISLNSFCGVASNVRPDLSERYFALLSGFCGSLEICFNFLQGRHAEKGKEKKCLAKSEKQKLLKRQQS